MKKVMLLVASLMVTISSFAGYTSDMINRLKTKEKSVEDSKKEQLKLRNEERAWIKRKERVAKDAADKFCGTVNGQKLCGTGYGLEYTQSLINSTKNRAIELSKRYEKLK